MNDLQLPCRTLFDPPWRTFLYNARALLSWEGYPRETSHGNSYDFSLHDFLRKVTEPARAICQFEDFALFSTTCHFPDTVIVYRDALGLSHCSACLVQKDTH